MTFKRRTLISNISPKSFWKPENGHEFFSVKFTDEHFTKEPDLLHYYARVQQKDEHLAWSGPVFPEKG